jgi:phage/plasmid-like protein (TIGR03299 family)
MFSVRQVPWHGLGKVIDKAPCSVEALRLAGLDWYVCQHLILASMPGGLAACDGYVANIRDIDSHVLGIVSKRYVLIQNREAFEFVDLLLNNGDVRFETAGSLHGGKVVWVLARLTTEHKAGGDEVAPYLLFANGHDGQFSVKVLMTPVRVVCANTLNLALTESKRTWTTAHVGDLKGRIHDAQMTLGMATHYLEELGRDAEILKKIQVPDPEWRRIINRLIPVPERCSQARQRNVWARREDLYLRRQAPDLANVNSTGWATVNAVADHVAHVPRLTNQGMSNPTVPINATETRFYDVATGHPMVDKACRMVREMQV